MLINIDIDDTICDLVNRWLELYNRDYKDTLRKSQITDWNISSFTKKECGGKIYDYLKREDLYTHVDMRHNALYAVLSLKNDGHIIQYVTAHDEAYMKREWLLKCGFYQEGDIYLVQKDKSNIGGEILIDDGFHNIEGFKGKGLLMNQPWNLKYDYKHRVKDWNDFLVRKEELLVL